ncbi:hypothetical protein [Pontibacter harenae]|uniref:hypothetical protein n=1 Tax=Pontibacter harenae TaxID=2894083 RepID=UPI001E2D50E8|nr:hypothetical protein [Pontibacter harenae]MCC9168084.1 hypothetical protein [Pontibacter harenae]
MKLFIFCLRSFFLTVSVLAQNLSVNTLIKLRQMRTPSYIHQKLEGKGWKLVSVTEPTLDKQGVAVWSYESVRKSDNAWVYLYYSMTDYRQNGIEYHPNCSCKMPKLQKKIKQRKMKKLDEGERREGIDVKYKYTAYADSNYISRLLTYPNEPNNIAIQIFDKDYYVVQENNDLL